jgi:hypothetical protein
VAEEEEAEAEVVAEEEAAEVEVAAEAVAPAVPAWIARPCRARMI